MAQLVGNMQPSSVGFSELSLAAPQLLSLSSQELYRCAQLFSKTDICSSKIASQFQKEFCETMSKRQFPQQWRHLLEIDWTSSEMEIALGKEIFEWCKGEWFSLKINKSDEFFKVVHFLAEKTGFMEYQSHAQ